LNKQTTKSTRNLRPQLALCSEVISLYTSISQEPWSVLSDTTW
jgi:hypothetical protein